MIAKQAPKPAQVSSVKIGGNSDPYDWYYEARSQWFIDRVSLI